jgi:uncharacterized protein (TIGR02118 family)
MAVKLNILYGQPTDPEAFEAYYLNTHVPLVHKMAGLQTFEYGRVLARLDGGDNDVFWMASLTFADGDVMGAALSSPEGVATSADVANFASGGATIYLSSTQIN